MSEDREARWSRRSALSHFAAVEGPQPASETPGPGEGDLRGEVPTAYRCPGCGWSTRDTRLEQHTCPTSALETPGPGEVEDRCRAEFERLYDRLRAAVEQRTLAEQKVARVEALRDALVPKTPTLHAVVAGQHLDNCIACVILADLNAALAGA